MQRPLQKYEIKEIVAYIALPKTSPFHFSPPPPSKYSPQVCPQGYFLQFISSLFSLKKLRANVSMHQRNSGKSPKFVFTPTFILCSPICSNNCGVIFFFFYFILVFEK